MSLGAISSVRSSIKNAAPKITYAKKTTETEAIELTPKTAGGVDAMRDSSLTVPNANGTFNKGVELPPDATVIRGGIGDPTRLKLNQLDDPNLYISANGGMGVSDATIAQGIKNGQVQITTVEQLNAAGYKVVASPSTNGSIYHVDIITPNGAKLTDAEAANLSRIFGSPVKNPAKLENGG